MGSVVGGEGARGLLGGVEQGDGRYRQWSLAQQFVREVLLDGFGVGANNPPAASTGGNSATVERRP